MKIMAISNGFAPVVCDGKAVKKNTETQTFQQLNNYTHSEKLAGFDVSRNLLVSPRNISFTAADDVPMSQESKRLLKEINEHKAEIEALKKVGDSEAVIKAKNENSFCDYFKANRDDLYKRADNAAYAAMENERKKHCGIANWFYSYPESAYDASFNNSEYSKKYDKYYNLIGRYESNKNIIEGGRQTAEERQRRIEKLEDLIKTKAKMLDYSAIPSLLNEYMSGRYGLNSKLAGYEDLKVDIKKFIGQLNNNSGKIPSCVMLYGAIGTGKTTALNCVKDSARENVDVVRFSLPANADFKRQFENYQEHAKEKFLEDGKRTILLMDDAEEYFAKTYEAALEHPEDYSQADLARLKEINTLGTNKYASSFKHILDVLSSEPDPNDADKAAMTIFITTNYPHIMHDDLLAREGKVHSFHVGPADVKDLAAVTKFYFKESNDKLNIIKALKYKSPEVQADSLGHISLITDKAKDELMKMFAEGAIDNLHIDTDNTDFENMMTLFGPKKSLGAFTNDQIAHISRDALEKYLENPMIDYKKHFISELVRSKRAIAPDAYAHFRQIEKKVNLKSGRLSNNGMEVYENVRQLLAQKMSGDILSEDNEIMLNRFLDINKPRYKALIDKQKKGVLEDETEAAELDALRNIYVALDDETEE